MKKKKELQEKISEANRFRRMAVLGLVLGLAFIILGYLLSFPALFIIGYTVFIICAGTTSFLTVLKWQYAKTLKVEILEETKPSPINTCPRCGTEIRKKAKYCPKCGKKYKSKSAN